MKSIALTGKKRVGKDTVADVLVKEYGYARVAFADELKRMALEINPYIEESDWYEGDYLASLVDFYGWEKVKDSWPAARQFLKNHGSSVRKRDPFFWINLAEPAIADAVRAGRPVVVTDVRYVNEAGYLQTDWGFCVVRITRPGVDDGDTHESETEMDGYTVDLNIWNDGPLSKIQNSARCLTL